MQHKQKEEFFMENKKVQDQTQMDSLSGTLFATITFVGGGILLFIILLFYFYLTRI